MATMTTREYSISASTIRAAIDGGGDTAKVVAVVEEQTGVVLGDGLREMIEIEMADARPVSWRANRIARKILHVLNASYRAEMETLRDAANAADVTEDEETELAKGSWA